MELFHNSKTLLMELDNNDRRTVEMFCQNVSNEDPQIVEITKNGVGVF
jgi:hypothetical protein